MANNRIDKELAKFRGSGQDVKVAVTDELSQQALGQILNALGGSTDTTATIYNVIAINASQEYNQALPANTKGFFIRARNKSKLKVAYESGGTSANYFTVPMGSNYSESNFYSSITLYFQTNTPGDIIEIVAFT